MQDFVLRKAIIKEQINPYEYWIEDVFNKEVFHMSIPKGLGVILKPSEIVYATVSPFDLTRGRLTNSTGLKANNLYAQKIILDKKHQALLKRQDPDISK